MNVYEVYLNVSRLVGEKPRFSLNCSSEVKRSTLISLVNLKHFKTTFVLSFENKTHTSS